MNNDKLRIPEKCGTCRWCWLCECGEYRCLNSDSEHFGRHVNADDLCKHWEVNVG